MEMRHLRLWGDGGTSMNKTCTLVLAAAWLAGCGDETSSLADDLVEQQSAIFRGTVLSAAEVNQAGLVAIYHPWEPEFPNFTFRPCSGVIVRSAGGQSVVLTARHCVTHDSSVGGNIVAPSRLRLLPTPNPGIARCPVFGGTACSNPAAPNGSVPASAVRDFPGQGDIAMITVQADWSAIANNRLGLYVGAAEALNGRPTTVYGYGVDTLAACNGPDLKRVVTGAGTARSGNFNVLGGLSLGGNPFGFTYNNTNPQEQRVMCGDSGGPHHAILWGNWRYVLGVTSTGVTITNPTPQGVAISREVQEALGGVFLSVRKIGTVSVPETKNVAVGAGGKISMAPAANVQVAPVVYDVATRRILFGTQCLGVRVNAQGQNEPFVTTCNANDTWQRWFFDWSTEMANQGTGQCMTAFSDSNVALAACNVYDDRQRWLFHAQR
jgi:hypothetical protein